ncbi:MAG: sigma-70 family RNA polymerase sigma factor [Acidimicrobiales bacterium]
MHRHTKFAPLLTRADEVRLAKAIAEGRAARDRVESGQGLSGDPKLIRAGETARRQFIEANVRLVLSLARRVRLPAHIERDDVIQDGMIGLERAVERFDHTKGFKFSTYAAWWIRQAMQRGLESTSTTIRIPEHQRGALRSAQRDRDSHGTPLTEELARLERIGTPDSLDRAIDDDATPLGSLVAGDDDPADAAERIAVTEAVEDLLGDLDPELADAIARRFGLRGYEPATYALVAAALGRSEESVRRQVSRTLQRLRPRALELAA